MKPPVRRDRFLGSVFAGLAALAAVVGVIVVGDQGPHEPASAVIIGPFRGGGNAELSVTFFGRPGFTRTSPDRQRLETEGFWWVTGPRLVVVTAAALVGGSVGWRVGSRLGRRGPAHTDDQAADYQEPRP